MKGYYEQQAIDAGIEIILVRKDLLHNLYTLGYTWNGEKFELVTPNPLNTLEDAYRDILGYIRRIRQ